MGNRCAKACREVGYRMPAPRVPVPGHEFYFIEMNTRVQVEHPVTELVTASTSSAQLLIAAGEPLGSARADVPDPRPRSRMRINAEDAKTFVPSPGPIRLWHSPGGPGIRSIPRLPGYNVRRSTIP